MAGFNVSYGVVLVAFLTTRSFAQDVSMYPQQVTLTAPAGSATAAVQTITVVATSSLQFEASVRHLNATTGWLTVSPATGTTPATLTISADASKLSAGNYAAQVTVSAGPSRSGAVVNVYFSVGSGSGGSLVTNPSGLTFVGQSATANQTLTLTSATGSPTAVPFTAFATSAGGWLSVSPSTGSTPATLTVVVNQVALNKGTYTGAITITPAGGSPTVVPVTLVSAGIGNIAETVTLSQNALTIRHQTGTSVPPVQGIGVFTNTGSNRQYTASTATDWLGLVSTLNPTVPASSVTDFTPSEFGVVIKPAGLAAGTYIGSITVAFSGLPAQEVPVSLTITTSPALNTNPSLVYIEDIFGTEVPVSVTSTGSSALSFTAVTATPWLSVTPSSGSTASGQAALAVKANTTGLEGGMYTGSISLIVQGSGATFSIPVRLKVNGSTESKLQISPKSVDFAAIADEANPSQTVWVVPDVPGSTHSITAFASAAGGWLAVTPFSGTAPGPLTLTASTTAVPPGTHNGSVTITSLATGVQDTINVSFKLIARTIGAEPASLAFVQQQRGAVPPPQTIQITANAPSSFKVVGQPNWTRINVGTTSTPSILTVSVDPAGLVPATYKGTIQLSGPSELSVPVSLTIPEPSAPTVTPALITFAHELGRPAPNPQSISIGSTSGAVKFTATASTESGINWLSVTPASGSTPTTVTASLNTALLVPGQHTGSVTVAPADGSTQPRTVPVTVNVTGSAISVRDVLNAATLAPTPVSPGQIVTITGTGLGPAVGAVARASAAGAIDTRLADVRVLFDGVPAPLLFVRNDQINAIVPYSLYGRVNTRVQVEAGASFSIPIDVKVVDTAPGLFTTGSSGRGQAAALNVDYTLNSMANPAQRGSVIMVFGTGEGQTDPAGQDGRIISTDLRRPLLRVTARIADRPVEVMYAGSASTLVSGAFQVNVRIPPDIEAGTLPLVIQVGEAVTQSGATIVVR